MRRLLGLSTFLLTVLPTGVLFAQASTGPGFRVGDFELHPGIGAEIGWDSNLFYTEDNGRRVDSAILRITPSFSFSTLTAPRRTEGEARDSATSTPPVVAFRGGVSAAYYEFFADSNRRNVELAGNLRLTILPERPFNVTIYEDFQRSVRPFTENGGGVSPARIGNQAGVDFVAQTDGGVVSFRLGYNFGLDFFEDARFQFGNSMAHRVTLQETFRFLPNTAIVHDTTFEYQDYFTDRSTASPVQLNDSARLRSRIGLNGALSENVSLMAMVGYAAGFFGRSTAIPGYQQDYDSIVAQAEVRWQIVEGTRLSIGYDRDFFPSFLGNYYSRDRGLVNFQATIGSFALTVSADVGFMDFGAIVGPTGGIIDASNGDRTDVRVGASLGGEYRFTDWLALYASARYQGAFTGYQYNAALTGGFIDPAGFNKFEVFGGVRVFY
jgi:hypothetical protein